MRAFGKRDFTLGKWAALCRELRDAGYEGLGLADYLGRTHRPDRVVLLRHDVENEPWHAVAMGRVERAHGLTATYLYRIRRFDGRAIEAQAALGHEIGYHYETLSDARGDMARALELFEEGLARLRRHAPVRVASMHGSPLLPWDNRRIWEQRSPADFGLAGEAYRDLDFTRVAYYSDTGRTWHPTRYNVRDRAGTPPPVVVDTTDELIELVRSGKLPELCLLAHPERWSATPLHHAVRAARDRVENVAKLAIARLWRLAGS